jgi:hypothetical protein
VQNIAVLTASLLVLVNAGCSHTPKLAQYDENSNADARSAPLVIVGVASLGARVGTPVPRRDDPQYPMQMHRVSVRVENVLRGSLDERSIAVYYFGFAGGFDGPRPLGFGGEASRRILWLRRDRGVFRMACDGWDYCTNLVESGAHPGYRVDPEQPLDRAIVDILLTRGEGRIDDGRFASEIIWGVPDQGIQDYVIDRLGHLASTESPEIKSSACVQLWIYTRDRIGTDSNRRAQSLLETASCHCRLKEDGNVTCE